MLSRQASHALQALLELAQAPKAWCSTHGLAMAQQLPEPMLEQLLLRLRRSGLLEARRGRLGGYRLAVPARDISVAAVLAALGESIPAAAVPGDSASQQVTQALQLRLERARQRALADLSLEDLLFDLRSAEAGRNSDTGLLIG